LISEATKEEIRHRVPLEELLRDYNITLLPAGRKLKALCPFHSEKTPSFQVDVEKQFYYCFGCQEGGDLFRFVQKIQNVDFPEALEILARRAGVTLEMDSKAYGKGSERGRLVKLYDALHEAKNFYHRLLLEGDEAACAREYLKRRGIAPVLWEKFELGYSPGEWDRLLKHALRKGIEPEALELSGLARKKGPSALGQAPSGYYDYFRGRLMFPIADSQSRVIGFGARTLGDEVPKYLNTPKTPVFDKSKVLYALPQARAGIQREGRIGIVEGYTDAIMAHQAGLDIFVASLGTAFTQENARRLSRIAPRVLLIFDGDAAGQRASERSLDLLVAENLDLRIYAVKDGKDPCDAISLLGGAEFRRRFEEESVGIFEFKWRRTMESDEAKHSGPSAKARALDEFLGLLARVPNIVARKLYLREFAERVGLREEDIEKRLQVISRRASRGPFSSPASASSPPSPGFERNSFQRSGFQGSDVPERNAGGMNAEISLESTGLAKLVLECTLALPHKGNVLWAQVPRDLFESPPLFKLAQAIDRQLEGDCLSPARLAQDVVDPEASGILLGLLSRLEDENGKPSCDYEEVWTNVQRDLHRYVKRKRVEELKNLMVAEKARGETEALQSLRREYFETLKELKR